MSTKAYAANYYQNHREKLLASSKKWKEEHRGRCQEYHRQYRDNHRAELRAYLNAYRERFKRGALTHYGNGKCACVICGFNDIRALTIDHINGGGVQHRKRIEIPSGQSFYQWLKNKGFPRGYQTLCANCNLIKWIEGAHQGRQ